MKKLLALCGVALVSLCLTACKETAGPVQTAAPHMPSEAVAQAPLPEIIGPWHLDAARNDLSAFADSLTAFPGYGEWGAGMEIRSNGLMSWYIGEEGWYGTYTVEEGVLRGNLTGNDGQTTRLWEFRVTSRNGTAALEMPYRDMTVYWLYGDREEVNPNGEV